MTTDPLAFYTMMGYPIPEDKIYFYYKKKHRTQNTSKTKDGHNTILNDAIQQHIRTIQKYQRLRKQLPYIKHIYLCDSISFAAANEKSDIDLLFITKHGCLRQARFRSVITFRIMGLKRTLSKKAGLFDLIMYIDEKKTNIEDIALKKEDIYLSYRLAHLIPLYQSEPYNIYTHNTRIKNTLPNFPMQHCNKSIPIQATTGQGAYKKIIEFLAKILPDNLWQQLRIRTWKPIVIRKTQQRHGDKEYGIIIDDDRLKFHKDKRKDIQQQRESQYTNNIQQQQKRHFLK